jgi:hypothetical protein
VANYFRHPAYSFYPVVGVSWDQAMAFCQWRTDRVNEKKLVDSKIIEQLPYDKIGPDSYMTEAQIDNFLKNNAATVTLQWYDILREKENISRSITATQRSDSWTNAINSYVMVHFIYKLNLLGSKSARAELGGMGFGGSHPGHPGGRGGFGGPR